MKQKYNKWEKAWLRFQERQDESKIWLPYPAFISFALAIILTFHMLVGLNPKLGNPADVLTLMSEAEKKGSLWISISLINEEIVVTTAQKDVFRWNAENPEAPKILAFKKTLKQMIENKLLAAGLSMKADIHQSLMTIAADKTIQYKHLQPIIQILADTGIAQYGLETRQTRKS